MQTEQITKICSETVYVQYWGRCHMVFLWGSKLDKMEIVMAYWGQKMGVAHLTQ